MNTDAEGNGSEFFPFMAAVLPCFTYAEKLTVMFSEEVVLSQRNKIQIESETCAKNRRKWSDESGKAGKRERGGDAHAVRCRVCFSRGLRPLCMSVHGEYTLTMSGHRTRHPCFGRTREFGPSPRLAVPSAGARIHEPAGAEHTYRR
jgi:hypothetical protein